MWGGVQHVHVISYHCSLRQWLRLSTPCRVAERYRIRLAEFEGHLPLIRALRTSGMRQRHWHRLLEQVPGLAELDVERSEWTLHQLLMVRLRRETS